MCGDCRIAPGQLAQSGEIMWVVEKAHVKDQIGISRYTVAIRERSDENAKTTGREGKMAGHQPLQIGGTQTGSIDHQISTFAQGRNHSAFEPDTVRYGPVAGERVGPASLGIAPLQALVITIDEEHLQLAASPTDDCV